MTSPYDPHAMDRQALLEENTRLRSALAQAGIDPDAPPPIDAPARAALDASQAALEETRRRLDGLLAMRTLGVLIWSAQLTLAEVNDGFLALGGWSREEALGQDWTHFTPLPFQPLARRALEETHATGEAAPHERPYLRKDGSLGWGLFAARRLDGDVLEVVLDVSERRQAQEALRASEEQLRLIVKSARDYAILTTDTTGRITQWWPGAAAVFGWSAQEIVGQPAELIFTPEDRRAGEPEKERAMARSLGAAPDVRWHQRRDGSRVFIEGHMSPLRGPHGELRGYLKIGRDITERWVAEEQLRRSEAALRHLNETLELKVSARTAELQHAVEALHAEALDRAQAEDALRQAQKMEAVGQLTGGIAHDFNNLLTGIIGSLDMLHARVSQGRYDHLERYLVAARGAADRAASLTHRLLAFSRRQTLAPRPTDLNGLVHGMLELLQRTIGPHIALQVTGEHELWATLCDPHQLENALLNLCINARDAMPGGGCLTLAADNHPLDARQAQALDLPPGRYVRLRVIDTGSGMSPAVAARAFDPFFTTKPQGQGTGLGLSMVYGFARQSGGQVRIDSTAGEGTVVSIFLPWHAGGALPATDPDEAAPIAARTAHATVLVVDDEPTVRMLVGEVLRELGYSALEAVDGASALPILQSDVHLDLLVTDVGLPGGINGRQLVDRARAVRPALKVLFITGYAEHSALGTLEPGMQVMPKPFAMQALANRIRRMLHGERAPDA